MGLDMYLSIKRNLEFKRLNMEEYDGLYYEKIELVGIGYWRKFWALHDYIVKCYGGGVDDCQPIYLSKEDIEHILSELKEVATKPTKITATFHITPDQSILMNDERFEWYIEDIKRSIPIFELALKTLQEEQGETQIVYRASW